MKTLFAITLIFVSLTITGQQRSEPLTANFESLAAASVLMGTAVTVHFMKTPPEYYGNDHLLQVRSRQRFTVALTGMASTAITYHVVKNIRHKVRRNKVHNRCNTGKDERKITRKASVRRAQKSETTRQDRL